MSNFETLSHAGADEIVDLWNRCAGGLHPLSLALWQEITVEDPSFRESDLAIVSGPKGSAGRRHRLPVADCALTKRLRRPILGGEPFADAGHLTLLAVDPAFQGQGLGRALLADAERSLAAQGCRRLVVGGSFFHAFPGVPAGLERAVAFLSGAGYRDTKTVWDVVRDVRAFTLPPEVQEALRAGPFEVFELRAERSMSADPVRTAALLEFLAAEFPGRWLADVSWAFGRAEGTAVAITLFEGPRVVAFAHVHLPGSPGARRWVAFDPRIAAIGPVGVARSHRGRGLGLAVVALAVDALRRRHAHRVVIDWTDLLDFYGKLGFAPWLSYRQMEKALDA